MVAENTRPGNALAVYLHEAGVHTGMQAIGLKRATKHCV